MKPSRRNQARNAAKQAKYEAGPPKVSRYAAKFAKPVAPTPPPGIRREGPGGRRGG